MLLQEGLSICTSAFQVAAVQRQKDPTLWRAAERTDHTHDCARESLQLFASLYISDPTLFFFLLLRPDLCFWGSALRASPDRHRISLNDHPPTTPAACSSPIAAIRVSPRRSSHTIFCPAFQCAQHRRTVVDLQPARRSALLRTSAEDKF